MPAALQIDWNHAKLLRFQGLLFREIAAEMGVSVGAITTRASREKWDVKQAAARASLTSGVLRSVSSSLSERAAAFVDRMGTDVERTLEVATQLPIKRKVKDLREREEVLGMVNKRGRSTFGLDQVTSQVTINVGVRHDVNIVPDQQSNAPAIDVESSQTTDPKHDQ